MIDDTIILLARTIALDYALDPALVCSIIEQESGGDTWATRFEPAFYDKYIADLFGLPAGMTTEKLHRATSWGLMQVMGQTAREAPVNYYGPLPALCDPNTGITTGCKVFEHKLALAAGDISKALDLWNGGGNPGYPAQVLARVATYKSATLPKASSSPTSI